MVENTTAVVRYEMVNSPTNPRLLNYLDGLKLGLHERFGVVKISKQNALPIIYGNIFLYTEGDTP